MFSNVATRNRVAKALAGAVWKGIFAATLSAPVTYLLLAIVFGWYVGLLGFLPAWILVAPTTFLFAFLWTLHPDSAEKR